MKMLAMHTMDFWHYRRSSIAEPSNTISQSCKDKTRLLSNEMVLSDQKWLLMAIASGKVNRVNCILSIGLHQKKGAQGLLASYVAATEGHYHPKSFMEEGNMKALVLWKLGGN